MAGRDPLRRWLRIMSWASPRADEDGYELERPVREYRRRFGHPVYHLGTMKLRWRVHHVCVTRTPAWLDQPQRRFFCDREGREFAPAVRGVIGARWGDLSSSEWWEDVREQLGLLASERV